jgi:hypothetical protein
MKKIDTRTMSDDMVVDLIRSFDRQGLPLNRRFEGDDEILRSFVKDHGINYFSVNFAVFLCVILREATIRGLTIPPVN